MSLACVVKIACVACIASMLGIRVVSMSVVASSVAVSFAACMMLATMEVVQRTGTLASSLKMTTSKLIQNEMLTICEARHQMKCTPNSEKNGGKMQKHLANGAGSAGSYKTGFSSELTVT